MFIHYPLLLILKLIKVNKHIVPSHQSSRHACMSDNKYICFNNLKTYFLTTYHILIILTIFLKLY